MSMFPIAKVKKIPTLLKLLVTSIKVVKDPNRLDDVLEVSNQLGSSGAEKKVVDFYKSKPETRDAFLRKPRVGYADLDDLMLLPQESLGYRYASFMKSRGLAPYPLVEGTKPNLQKDSDELFLIEHLRESHDIWHVVTDFDTDVAGELGLQAFYAAQNPSPFPIIILSIGLLNTLIFAMDDKERRLDAIQRGWSLGKKAKPLFGVDWKNLYTRPFLQVKQELALT